MRCCEKNSVEIVVIYLGMDRTFSVHYNSTGTPFHCNDDEILQLFHLAFGRTAIHPKEICS
ncbi:MAG: hypothetical protein ICV78_01195 [Tolypothrix sp. Co-bin9]|nr:hypothetical protein [Tolypothrix sp. Co-bin9]